MEIVYNEGQLASYAESAPPILPDAPLLVDKYLRGLEIEVDAIFDGEDILVPGIFEHIERAGIHSGDSISVYPTQTIDEDMEGRIVSVTAAIAKELGIRGLINIQFVLHDGQLYIIEANPRASRTVPIIQKATGINLVEAATRIALGEKLRDMPFGIGLHPKTPYVVVKAPVFSFSKMRGVETVLGPEMKSTGEVMGVADNFGEAFAKAQLSAGQVLPVKGTVFFSVNDRDKASVVELAWQYVERGFQLVATHGTADVLERAGLVVERVHKVKEGRPNIVDLIKGDRIHLIVNTPHGQDTFFDEKAIRRAAVTQRIPTMTTMAAARAAAEGINATQRRAISVS
ncbi:MAG: ATP-grasp domain-containing protein, partial [Gemmataceae bacterium]